MKTLIKQINLPTNLAEKLGPILLLGCLILLGNNVAAAQTQIKDALIIDKPKDSKLVTESTVAPPVKPVTQSAPDNKGKAKANPVARTFTVVGLNRNIKQAHFAGLSKAVVLKMQKQLEAIYQDIPEWKYDYSLKHQPLNDGIVGPITLYWLQRFTYNFKIETEADYAKTLPDNIDKVALFGNTHPKDLIILLSVEFEDWQNQLSESSRKADYQIRRKSIEKELTELVNRYLASKKPGSNVRTQRKFEEDGYYRYALTQADFDLLAGKDQVVVALDAMKDKEYPSIEALKVAAGHALGDRDYLLKQTWPIIERHVGEFDGFEINDAIIAKLKKQNVSQSLLDELNKRSRAYFKNKEDFDSFLSEVLTKLDPDTSRYFTQVYEAARVFDNVHLTAQSLLNIKNELKGNIRNTGVPLVIVNKLKVIQDVSYPEASIFHSAVLAKINFTMGICRANLVKDNQNVAELRAPDNDYAEFIKDIEALQVGGNFNREFSTSNLTKVFENISFYRNKIDQCESDELKEAKRLVQGIYEEFLAGIIEDSAKKKLPDTITPAQISGADCGCALDDLSGVVYGFYPYWNTPKEVQTINFRVLNRIAFSGLTVDNVGELHLGNKLFDIDDGSEASNQFVRVARQYNTQVDWLIQKNDWGAEWRKFTRENKQAILKKLIVNISGLLRARLSDPMSRAKPYLTLGMQHPGTRGDGVSIYFQNYPQDLDSTLVFNDFYHALRKELAKDAVSVNLVIPQNTLVGKNENRQGAFSLANLVKIRKESSLREASTKSTVNNVDGYVLVLLEEPSTDAKKRLRSDIESESSLRGAERVSFLRSIVPILEFDNHNWQQLEDDIVYAKDNFGGVGFWAPSFENLSIPITDTTQTCATSKQMSLCLLLHFREDGAVAKSASPLEKFACVYRGYLQLLMNFFMLLFIITVLLFFASCNAQNFIKRYFIWILLFIFIPPVIIFTLLLIYDPAWSSLSKGNLPFIISSSLGILGLVLSYFYVRSLRETPQRQRVTPQRQKLGSPILLWTIRNSEDFQWVVRNEGESLGVINKVEIFVQDKLLANCKELCQQVLGDDYHTEWKEAPLIGRALMPQDQIMALSIADKKLAKIFKTKLRKFKLEVSITYCSADNEYWLSNGTEVTSIPKPD